MEGVSEPTIKSEKEDQIRADSECKGEGTQSSVNLSENACYVKDILQIKDEPEQVSDCIKKEVEDEVEVGFEEWEEFGTEERDCFPGCVEGDLTDVSWISLTHAGLTEFFQKVKVEGQGDAEFNDSALEAVLDAAEGKNVKPEEDWCELGSRHKSYLEVESERMSRKKSGFGKGHLVRLGPGNIFLLHRNLVKFDKSEKILRKKFGCEREAVVKLARLSMDTTLPMQGIGSNRKMEHMAKETVMFEFMEKCLLHGPNIAKDLGRRVNNKGDSAELEESFAGRNNCGQLSAKAFDKSNWNQCRPINNKETQFPHNHSSYAAGNKDMNVCITPKEERKFACAQCSYETKYRRSFIRHCLIHSNIKKFACHQCSYKTNYRSCLTQHCLNHSNIKKFACNHCSFKTNSKSHLTRHCINHSNIKEFACDQCSFKTNETSSFTKHSLNHSNIHKFACDQCSYKTNYRSSFTQHHLIHNNIKKFACDQCSFKTNDGSSFTKHCLNHSNIRIFACDQCSYKTNYRSSFTQHHLIHNNIKKFACDHCSYMTNYRTCFTKHCLSHSNINNFACDQCSYKTNYRSAFIQHCLIHSDTKKFACDQCSYKTNYKSDLARHSLTHSNIKKFLCYQCSYKTNYRNDFTKHCLSHSNIKICL